jgi:hypothetical protein
VLAVALALAGAHSASAAVSFTGTSAVVDFNGVAGDAGSVFVANDSTVPGLFLYISGGSGAVAGIPDTVYRGTGTGNSTGSSTYTSGTAHAFYFYRPAGNLANVSLGFYNTDSNSSGVGSGYIAAGLLFVNNSGESIPAVTLDYLIGASTNNFTNADSILVSWAIGATGVKDSDAAWTNVPGLGYSVAGTGGVVTPPSTDLISGLDWDPGETLMIRFRDGNVGSTDRLSWIDNVTLTAVPEPSSMAIAGVAGLMACLRRRRL